MRCTFLIYCGVSHFVLSTEVRDASIKWLWVLGMRVDSHIAVVGKLCLAPGQISFFSQNRFFSRNGTILKVCGLVLFQNLEKRVAVCHKLASLYCWKARGTHSVRFFAVFVKKTSSNVFHPALLYPSSECFIRFVQLQNAIIAPAIIVLRSQEQTCPLRSYLFLNLTVFVICLLIIAS